MTDPTDSGAPCASIRTTDRSPSTQVRQPVVSGGWLSRALHGTGGEEHTPAKEIDAGAANSNHLTTDTRRAAPRWNAGARPATSVPHPSPRRRARLLTPAPGALRAAGVSWHASHATTCRPPRGTARRAPSRAAGAPPTARPSQRWISAGRPVRRPERGSTSAPACSAKARRGQPSVSDRKRRRRRGGQGAVLPGQVWEPAAVAVNPMRGTPASRAAGVASPGPGLDCRTIGFGLGALDDQSSGGRGGRGLAGVASLCRRAVDARCGRALGGAQPCVGKAEGPAFLREAGLGFSSRVRQHS